MINFLSTNFESFPVHFDKGLSSYLPGRELLKPLRWSLFQLKDKKYFIILGFTDCHSKCSVMLGTFDLEDGCDVSNAAKLCEMSADCYDDTKRLKMTEYRLTNFEVRLTPLTDRTFTHCIVK